MPDGSAHAYTRCTKGGGGGGVGWLGRSYLSGRTYNETMRLHKLTA